MKKNYISLRLFYLLLFCVFNSYSQTFNDGILEYTVITGTNVSVNKYNNTCPTGTLVIPETVDHNTITYTITAIVDNAFEYCFQLTGNLVLPNSIMSIGNEAFVSCDGFIGDLILPNNLSYIGDSAFSECYGLNGNLIFPNGISTIGNYAFYYCEGLTGDLLLPNSISYLGYGAFESCSGFDGNLILPNGITSIGFSTFRNCSGLTGDVILPEGITSIAAGSFYECSGLNSIYLSSSITSIASGAFGFCTGLTSVTALMPTPVPIIPSVFSNVSIGDIPLTVPTNSVDAYKLADVWKDFKFETLSTKKVDLLSFKLYPNPAKEFLYIDLNKNETLIKIVVYSYLGQLMMESKSTILNINNLSKGMYIVKVESNLGVKSQNLVVK